MTDRIHRVLDGDLPASRLTPGERDRLDRARATVDVVAGTLRSMPDPELVERVMASLEPPAAGPERRSLPSAVLEWLWRPRSLTLRPAYALAAALLALLPLGLDLGQDRVPEVARVQTAAEATGVPVRVFVQFRFQAVDASQVALAGSFTDWSPEIRLEETMPGVWSAPVPLEPGVHDYTFVVDGDRWVADPAAPQVDDGFGGTNSRLFLTTPAGNA